MQDEREKKSLFLRKFENMKKIHRRKVLSQSRKKKKEKIVKKRFERLPRILAVSESDALKEDGRVSQVSFTLSLSGSFIL